MHPYVSLRPTGSQPKNGRSALFLAASLLLGLAAVHPAHAGDATRNLSTEPDSQAPQKVKPQQAESASGLKVVLTVEGRPAGQRWGALKSGATLRTGDAVRTKVKLSAPAYVYVAQFFADNTAVVLYPAALDNQNRLPQGVFVTLPEPGFIFSLDQNTGEEHMYVIASLRPLQEVDASLVEALEQVQLSTGTAGDSAEARPVAVPQPEATPGPDPTAVPTPDTAPPDTTATKQSAPAGEKALTDKAPADSASTDKATTSKSREQSPEKPKRKSVVFTAQKPVKEQQVAMKPSTRVSRASLDMNTRGLMLSSDPEAKEASLVYAADKDGVAVLHFELNHVK